MKHRLDQNHVFYRTVVSVIQLLFKESVFPHNPLHDYVGSELITVFEIFIHDIGTWTSGMRLRGKGGLA